MQTNFLRAQRAVKQRRRSRLYTIEDDTDTDTVMIFKTTRLCRAQLFIAAHHNVIKACLLTYLLSFLAPSLPPFLLPLYISLLIYLHTVLILLLTYLLACLLTYLVGLLSFFLPFINSFFIFSYLLTY